MAKSKHTLRVALSITDFSCDPAEITREIGLEPTKVWYKGDRTYGTAGATYQSNGWKISSGAPENAPLDEHLEDLYAKVEPRKALLVAVARQYESELAVWVDLSVSEDEVDTPALHLDKKAVAFLAELGAEVDFDVIPSIST